MKVCRVLWVLGWLGLRGVVWQLHRKSLSPHIEVSAASVPFQCWCQIPCACVDIKITFSSALHRCLPPSHTPTNLFIMISCSLYENVYLFFQAHNKRLYVIIHSKHRITNTEGCLIMLWKHLIEGVLLRVKK